MKLVIMLPVMDLRILFQEMGAYVYVVYFKIVL